MPPEACLVHSEQKVLQVGTDGIGWSSEVLKAPSVLITKLISIFLLSISKASRREKLHGDSRSLLRNTTILQNEKFTFVQFVDSVA